jgi:hypothetical protein
LCCSFAVVTRRCRDTWRSDQPRADQSIQSNQVGSQFVCLSIACRSSVLLQVEELDTVIELGGK